MVAGPDFARDLRPGEEAEVDALLHAAFPGPEEAALVRRLRAEGDMVQEMVLPWQGRIGAYAGSAGWPRRRTGSVWRRLPFAVWRTGRTAHRQRRMASATPIVSDHGWFSRIAAGFSGPDLHDCLTKTGMLDGDQPIPLVVLGKPSLYARAGFSLSRAVRLTSPYPVAFTLVLRPGDDLPEAGLIYRPACAEVP